ncbi:MULTISPECIES: PqqD family protein [unclassified Kitasatospora]|uniref:PqqD family protein n=1 Tax=unclassified Kitasatospora TaxID=2633591 RepID=UPI001ADEC2F4|nr:PqqD family protein [Kitasatospora sp. RG8]MBP0451896.1 PqqD family protein [Kitasatospora sp. RG8]
MREDEEMWTRVRPVSGVTGSVGAGGTLELRRDATGARWTGGASAAAMWIALQQHGWRLDATAIDLGRAWGMDPLLVRVALGRWVDELLEQGVVEDASEPCLRNNPPGGLSEQT